MESNSNIKVPFERDAIDSCCNNRVENGKEEEHGAGGLNGDEVGPPCVGMVFASQDEVRSYYSKYAQREGFGIMRRSSRCREDGKLTYFILACAQSGKTRSIAKKRFQFRQLTKTNCKAKINVVVEPEGCVHICNVVLEHNHELSPGKKQRNICKRSGTPRNKRKYALEELVGAPVQLDSRLASRESWAPLNLPSVDYTLEGANFPHQLATVSKHLVYANNTGHSVGEVMFGPHKRRSSVPEASQNSQDSLRRALAKRAVGLVKSGMVVSLGTGSTLSLVFEELGKLIREGKLKDILAVGANYQSRFVARQFGMETVDLNDVSDIDIAFDVVDEVDFSRNLLKCRGGTHTIQKVVDSMAKVCVILTDYTKVVHRLGSNIPVAVEVLPIAVSPVLRRLVALGGVPEIRSALRKDGPVVTDLGNVVVDVGFPSGIQSPAELEKNINMIPGVVDNGIVSGVAACVIVAVKDGGNVKVMSLEEFVEVVLGRRDANSTL